MTTTEIWLSVALAITIVAFAWYWWEKRRRGSCPPSQAGHITVACAALIDRIMPNALVVILVIYLLTRLVLDHASGDEMRDGAKDILQTITTLVIGGLLTCLGVVLKAKSKSDDSDESGDS